jgi:hypothetical protein
MEQPDGAPFAPSWTLDELVAEGLAGHQARWVEPDKHETAGPAR